MTTSFASLLQQFGLATSPFAANSRYAGIDLAEWESPGGRSIRYVRRRMIPVPDPSQERREYEVKSGDRPDILAGRLLGDPERFWQIADSGNTFRPEELTDSEGKMIIIP